MLQRKLLFLLLLFSFVIFLSEHVQSNDDENDFDWVRDRFAERERQNDDDAQFSFKDPTVIIGNRGVRSDDVLKYPLSKRPKGKINFK